MELTSGQRKAAFVLVVLILAGLGAFLFGPSFGVGSASGTASPQRQGSAAPAPASSPAASPSATVIPTPASSPSPGGTKSGSGRPDIYQWLPFSQQELGTAAGVATRFGAAYGTYSYTENSASYVGAMRNLITPALSQLLARGYSAPGVAGPRASSKQVAVGSASIGSLRAFGSSSLTFVVTFTQQVTSSKGRSGNSNQYAVTVTGSGTSWQVSDIEPASAGNT